MPAGTLHITIRQLLRNFLNSQERSELLLGIALSSLFINLLSLAFPIMILQLYDRVVPNQSMSTLNMLVLFVLCAVLGEIIFRIARAYLTSWSAARYEHKMSVDAYQHLLMARLSQFKKEGVGVYLDRLSSLCGMKDFYGGQALTLLLDFPFVILYLGLIAYIANFLVLIPILTLGMFGLFGYYVGVCMQNELTEKKLVDERRFSFILEILSGIYTVKSMAIESFMLRRYERLQNSSANQGRVISSLSSVSGVLSGIFMQVNIILVVSVGSIYVIAGDMTIGSLAACTLLANRSLNPINNIMMFWKRMQSILVAEKGLEKIYEMQREDAIGKVRINNLKGTLDLTNVDFKYEGTEKYFFKDLNLSIPTGKTIAIMGDASCGKTTLMELIMGLYEPTKGEIKIGDQNIQSCDKSELRKAIAYLPQKSYLFKGTILDNLTLFREGDYLHKAIETIKTVGLEHIIYSLPDGYETEVGKGVSDSLPAGVKQGILIAQNLIDEPSIFIFDQSNINNDKEDDKRICKFLNKIKGSYTIILVSNKAEILKIADECYQIKNKKLEKFIYQDKRDVQYVG